MPYTTCIHLLAWGRLCSWEPRENSPRAHALRRHWLNPGTEQKLNQFCDQTYNLFSILKLVLFTFCDLLYLYYLFLFAILNINMSLKYILNHFYVLTAKHKWKTCVCALLWNVTSMKISLMTPPGIAKSPWR